MSAETKLLMPANFTEATIYLKRMVNNLDAVRHVENGHFPVDHFENIPIHGELDFYGRGPKGLLFGLKHSVEGSYRMLGELGYQKEAESILAHDRRERELNAKPV